MTSLCVMVTHGAFSLEWVDCQEKPILSGDYNQLDKALSEYPTAVNELLCCQDNDNWKEVDKKCVDTLSKLLCIKEKIEKYICRLCIYKELDAVMEHRKKHQKKVYELESRTKDQR